jgi:Domain of unknown function (DUF4365)
MNKRDKYLINLPKSDDNDELQTNSIKALNIFLPTDKLHFRDERTDDKGVDGSLEVKEKGVFTNFRSPVQLKGTRSISPNKDGSYSLKDIKTSNLNYLLNNPISIYILYIEPKNEFRFIWAGNEFQRLAKENPNWMEQKTVTLHFKNILDSENLEQIRDQIIKQSSLNRDLNETLLLSQSSNVVVEIDPNTFEINDSKKNKEMLLTRGISYCLAGYSSEILEKINLLNSEDRKIPRVQIIKAIAEFEKRLFQRAKETLTILESNNTNLSEDDQLIKTFIKLHCNYETGKIEHIEFVKKLKELAERKHKLTPFNFRLNYLKNAINSESDLNNRRKLVDEFKKEVEKDINEESINIVDLRNRFMVLEIEGLQIESEFSKEMGQLLLTATKGFKADFDSAFTKYIEEISNWERQVDEVAYLSKNDVIVVDTFCLKALVFIHQQTTLLLLSKYYPFYEKIPIEVINTIKTNLVTATEIYSKNELMEQQLRAKILLAQILLIQNQDCKADAINSSVSGISDDMNYASIKYLANNPLPKKVKESLNKKIDSDELRAELNDETIALYSQQQIDALKIPQDRLDNIRKSFCFVKDRAIERLEWCENLEVLEDSRHTLDLSTYYSKDPNRRAMCIKHYYELNFVNPNWKLVISLFKKSYCENCPDRKPKKNTHK